MFIGAVATAAAQTENETSLKELKNGLFSGPSLEESKDAVDFDVSEDESTVSITVVGASGDLAKKKIFPALFALYYEGFLPKVYKYFLFILIQESDISWFKSAKMCCIFLFYPLILCICGDLFNCSTLLFMVMLGVKWLMQNLETWLAGPLHAELIRGESGFIILWFKFHKG